MFPDAIENRHIYPIPQKKETPKSETKSNSPVSLLPTLGKILEKLLLERLNFHLRTNNLQAANQYGFTVNKSPEEAIVDFIDEIEMARSTKQHAWVISLDVKGAFDHLEYNSIKNSLNNINFHSNRKETLIDLLSDRQVALKTRQGPDTLPQHRGCPQGSCAAPAFWNLVANEVLTQSWPEGVHLQAFADDFIFLIKAPTKAKVRFLANEALNQFKSWAAKHNLEISADKSNYMYFNKNRNGSRWSAGIRWDGNHLRRKSSIKYLVIFIDDKLKDTKPLSKNKKYRCVKLGSE
ncbi:Retrovirus-related Pol polyprotein from type-1 retrotransposable element R1 [Araneus ventricosus]|uniref:Retrovirus-related Pol polyprotein from type-1 retrotransposable element R1 n=1 Tax=Araneus ventricosus TaxID=182803 RepID=A0A4Y2EK52_ARAVE|nr:Retrovirus-related Pol polyprotein from type-1 retrotransposable element R1 [Araneus ventricosus]